MIISHDLKAVKANWKHLKNLYKEFGTLNYPRLVEYGHLKPERHEGGRPKVLEYEVEQDDKWYIVLVFG